jgi:hypothetical protein
VGIFRKPADPIGEIETSLAQLRRRRDVLAAKLTEAQIGCEKAGAAWQTALDGDDSKVIEKAGAGLARAKEFCAHLEAALDDYARQIDEAEAAVSFAQDRAVRESKAANLDGHASALQPMFKDYLEVSERFANELSKIEGLFDVEAAGALVRQTSEALQGARDSILGQMQWMAGELRREQPPRAPEPRELPAGTMPRGIVPGRNDPHEPAMWAGDRAFP